MKATAVVLTSAFAALLGSAVLAADEQPVNKPWSYYEEQIKQRSPEDQKAILVCVRGGFLLNYQETVQHNMSKGEEEMLWAMKTYARAYARMSMFADSINWPEASQYFRSEAMNMADLINGTITPMEYTAKLDAFFPEWEAAIEPIRTEASFSSDVKVICNQVAVQVIGSAKLHASY